MAHSVLIVDDERLARVALRSLLEERDDISEIREAASVREAVDALRKTTPGLVFLDIQMPDGSGFDVLNQVEFTGSVIFVTAYSEFALRAFEVNALDYLVKPVDPERLAGALSRIESSSSEATEATAPLRPSDTTVLLESRRMRFVQVAKIVCVRSADDYTEVHIDGAGAALVSIKLRDWVARLPTELFIRVHRTALVNVGYIGEIISEDGRWMVVVRDVGTVPVSRQVAADFRRRAQGLEKVTASTKKRES